MKSTLMICLLLIIPAYINGNDADSFPCSLGPKLISAQAATGTIRSPGYPRQYYRNENCHWILYPPSTGGYDLIVVYTQFRIHPLNATEEHHCTYSSDYVDFGGVTGCGSEELTCFVYLMATSISDNCYEKYMRDYDHCYHHTADEWPFIVSFHTVNEKYDAGFEMNYTFIPCAGKMNAPELLGGYATKEIVNEPETESGNTTKATTTRKQYPSLSNPENSQSTDNGIYILAAVIAFLTIFTLVVVAATLRRRSRAKSRSQRTLSSENCSCNSDKKTTDDNIKKQALPLETVRIDDEAMERRP